MAGFGFRSDVEVAGSGWVALASLSCLLLRPAVQIRVESRNGDPVLGLGPAAVGRLVGNSLDQSGAVQGAERPDHGALGASGYAGEVVEG